MLKVKINQERMQVQKYKHLLSRTGSFMLLHSSVTPLATLDTWEKNHELNTAG